ncbi:hypothetical protein JCM10449v2_006137 [Rhodotorula kratochvilovae]
MSITGPGGAKLAVVLLNAEGDQFNASSIAQGEAGGRAAAEELHRLARQEVAASGDGGGEAVVHLVTRSKEGLPFVGGAAHERWLAGFASAPKLCHISLPLDDSRGGAGRILQLLTLYLPLASISTIFIGSLHTNYLAPYLEGLPPRLRSKICLLETVTVAPDVHMLVVEGLFRTTKVFKSLFGEMDGGDEVFDFLDVKELKTQLQEVNLTPSVPRSDPVAAPAPARTPFPAPAPVEPPSTGAPRSTLADAIVAPLDVSQSIPPLPPVQQELQGAATPKPPPTPRKEQNKPVYDPASKTVVRPTGLTKQDRFPVDSLPAYPQYAFKHRLFRFPIDRRPCNHFWLGKDGCGFADTCSYSHTHPFTLEEFKDYRLFVKSTPCQDLVKRGRCKMGEDCVHGHRCPHTERDCLHLEKGMCHYARAGLPHSEPAPRGRRL